MGNEIKHGKIPAWVIGCAIFTDLFTSAAVISFLGGPDGEFGSLRSGAGLVI